MFKGKKSRIISASVAIVLVLGITAFAKQATETISVMYDNIKILIDGEEYTAKDANGNVIEPFIYNGTTYLPVRGIANAFDVDVNWDNENNAVELGYSQADYLSQLSYVDYTTNNEKSKFSVVNTYDLKFDTNSFNEIGKQCVAYKLDNSYDCFMFTLTSTASTAYGIGYVNIYGNDKELLYSSIGVATKETSIPVSVNIKDQKIIYIEVVNDIDINTTNIVLKNAKILGKKGKIK